MTRRRLFKIALATAVALAGSGSGLAVETVRVTLGGVRARVRVPRDLLVKIQRRTRPLDPTELTKTHDLAG